MRTTAVLCTVFVIGLLVTSEAYAQDSGGTPSQPPPGSGTPNFPPPNTPPPAAAPGAAPPPAAAPAPAAEPYREGEEGDGRDEGRLRIGFNVNGGWGTGGDVDFKGPALGATFRIGWQLNRLMGAYGQVSAIAWIASTDKTVAGSTFDVSAIGGYQFTPMFSLTPIGLLELAAGPSLDRLSGGSTSNSIANNTVNTTVTAYSGFYFALHGRAALHIGGKPNTTTGRRVSFTIGFDVHPTFAEGSTVTFYTLGLGADWY